MELLTKLLVAGGVMGFLDYIWLGYVAKGLYSREMGQILRRKPYLPAALSFYAIYVVGVIVFVINPALAQDSVSYAAGYGALFGLIAYGTYDLTGLAVIKGFTTRIAIIDMLWGAALTAVMSAVTVLIT
jgi:uncharacterized membrane protein